LPFRESQTKSSYVNFEQRHYQILSRILVDTNLLTLKRSTTAQRCKGATVTVCYTSVFSWVRPDTTGSKPACLATALQCPKKNFRSSETTKTARSRLVQIQFLRVNCRWVRILVTSVFTSVTIFVTIVRASMLIRVKSNKNSYQL
jgi:hypothetical protein